ncbi:MAG: hypothetical protein Q9195_006050 [Heterodermia aff. obscurata]
MIERAVERRKDQGVKLIDIQANRALDGHRVCEPGVNEPDQNNDKLFFWHYPYDEPRNNDLSLLINASSVVTKGLSTDDLSAKFTNGTQYTNAVFDALDKKTFTDASIGNVDARLGWDQVGWRAKLFHPQVNLHYHIKDLVFAQYKKDTASTAVTKPDINKCHGGNDSVDHLRLSVTHNGNGPNTSADAPNCNGHFIDGVIDGCDGNDPINNPHNYKFGSTLTTGDGWVFRMEPLAQQISEDTCDVSYRFALDKIEVRGKDWPDAKLVANGKGLKKQLKGCGALTKWKFEWTSDDVKYQWPFLIACLSQSPVAAQAASGRDEAAAPIQDSSHLDYQIIDFCVEQGFNCTAGVRNYAKLCEVHTDCPEFLSVIKVSQYGLRIRYLATLAMIGSNNIDVGVTFTWRLSSLAVQYRPRSITTAVVEGGKSAVFFVNEDNNISIYRSQEQFERPKAQGGPKYVEDFVYPIGADKQTSAPLPSGGKDLAAISYYDDVGKQVCTRLYYVDPNNILSEYCKDGTGGQWYSGALNNKNVEVLPDTSLAAGEEFPFDPVNKVDIKQLKVYYFGKNGRANVAWATINKGDWQVNKEIQ